MPPHAHAIEVDAGTGFAESPSGLLLPERLVQEFTGVDLFAGAGGMSLGFMQAGCTVLAAVDNWAAAALTYMANLGAYPCQFHFVEPADELAMETEVQREIGRSAKAHKGVVTCPTAGSAWISHHPDVRGIGHFFFGDARKLTGREILDAIGLEPGQLGCVFGGPPCQGFSTAGKRNVMDVRNSLVFEFARLVCEMQPETCVIENVPGMASMVTPEGLPVPDVFCRILEDGGWAGADVLRRSIASHPEARAFMRARKAKAKKCPKAKPSEASPLFAQAKESGK